MASDPSGNFVVVWASALQDGSSWSVVAQRYDSGGAPMGPEFIVNTHTSDAQRFPAIASDGSGTLVAVWMSSLQDGSFGGVFGQRYASTGAPAGSEFRVNTYTTSEQTRPSVASDPAGNFVVVWQGQDGSYAGIFGERYASTGAPVGPEFRVNSNTVDSQLVPVVASDDAGNFVVVWEDLNLAWDIFGQRYSSAGVPLGPAFRINTYTFGPQRHPSVAANGSGDFVVTWQSFDNYSQRLLGQRYASDGVPLGPEFSIGTYTITEYSGPDVAMDAAGNFVVVWGRLDGSSDGIFGQRYASSGAPLGPEFRVNTYTTGAQQRPSIGLDPAGRFVVVWESDGQDGQLQGVFGQRFSEIVPVGLMRFGVE